MNDQQFNAVVCQILSGDTIMVEDASGATKRVMLASVRAPRLATVTNTHAHARTRLLLLLQ